jgi:hypothetical protein
MLDLAFIEVKTLCRPLLLCHLQDTGFAPRVQSVTATSCSSPESLTSSVSTNVIWHLNLSWYMSRWH